MTQVRGITGAVEHIRQALKNEGVPDQDLWRVSEKRCDLLQVYDKYQKFGVLDGDDTPTTLSVTPVTKGSGNLSFGIIASRPGQADRRLANVVFSP